MTITNTRAGKGSSTAEPRRSRGRPQARPDEETRAVILDAARHEFAASGYAATSMESVARAAGVSTRTLYRLIPNKGTLFEAMINERIDRFASVVRLRACEGRDIEAALREALVVCGELMLDADVIALQRVILGEGDTFPDLAGTFYRRAIVRTQNTLAAWLEAQHKRGLLAVADAEQAAGLLLGMLALQPLRATMFGHAPAPGREEIEQRAGVCAALFLKGCAA